MQSLSLLDISPSNPLFSMPTLEYGSTPPETGNNFPINLCNITDLLSHHARIV